MPGALLLQTALVLQQPTLSAHGYNYWGLYHLDSMSTQARLYFERLLPSSTAMGRTGMGGNPPSRLRWRGHRPVVHVTESQSLDAFLLGRYR